MSSSRSERMECAMAYGTKACGREDAMLGTFIPEDRGEPGIHGSMAFTPEIAEEEERVVHNDRFRTRRPDKTFKSRERVKAVDYRGCLREVTETRDEWMLNEPFVPLDEIVDPRTDFQVQVGESGDDDEG